MQLTYKRILNIPPKNKNEHLTFLLSKIKLVRNQVTCYVTFHSHSEMDQTQTDRRVTL